MIWFHTDTENMSPLLKRGQTIDFSVNNLVMIRFCRLKNWPCLRNLFNRLVYFSLNNLLRNIPQIKLRMINILLHAFEKNVRPTLVSRSPPNCMHGSLAWLAPPRGRICDFRLFWYLFSTESENALYNDTRNLTYLGLIERITYAG